MLMLGSCSMRELVYENSVSHGKSLTILYQHDLYCAMIAQQHVTHSLAEADIIPASSKAHCSASMAWLQHQLRNLASVPGEAQLMCV